MKTYAIISDIHSNLEALTVVLDYIEDLSPDIIISLGDIVGYGPNPKECLNLVEKKANIQIIGNWDYAVYKNEYAHFNEIPKESFFWTRDVLSDYEKKKLGSLPFYSIFPFSRSGENAMFVHGSPRSPLKDYVSPDLPSWTYTVFFEISNDFTEIDFLFLGHTHKPLHIVVGRKHLFNPGSVGQPRDGDPRASFMVFNIDEETLNFDYELVRLEYDIQTTQEKMKENGFNEFLINRLSKGL
ncbi:MAG: metallophosphatase family protein [Candidatus Heimdallarchaeum aukensis]|uniref:Metallophosphatase family protein n=1 Tax=Candidatus Heimdallarchaeum aukensis TaxID=2876573 RepID=A0A9Y1BNH7_9ARCH|nr:MAG: metallophosphatase family protein [Candidatus Heimdallarchaeum aukensis]